VSIIIISQFFNHPNVVVLQRRSFASFEILLSNRCDFHHRHHVTCQRHGLLRVMFPPSKACFCLQLDSAKDASLSLARRATTVPQAPPAKTGTRARPGPTRQTRTTRRLRTAQLVLRDFTVRVGQRLPTCSLIDRLPFYCNF